VPSSPGCWKTFGEVQADEIQRFGYPPAHGLVVDAYMAQHPGHGTDRRDRQSVFVHLVGLCARLEHHAHNDLVRDLFRRVLASRSDFPVLSRSSGPGVRTVLHMVGASDVTDYERRAYEWATAVWKSWSGEHRRIRHALRAAIQTPRQHPRRASDLH
jgi:hypothetical protein